MTIRRKTAKKKSAKRRNPCLPCNPSTRVTRFSRMKRNPDETEIDEVIKDLLYPHDGPVTDFVILSRTTKLAADGKYNHKILANAAYVILFPLSKEAMSYIKS